MNVPSVPTVTISAATSAATGPNAPVSSPVPNPAPNPAPDPSPDPSRIRHLLVIRLSGLGDLILSLRSLCAIRDHYSDARITLLTTKPYAKLCWATGLIDRVWIDGRPRIGKLHHLVQFRQRLVHAGFDLVIDLQRNDRTAMYFHMLLSHQPPWSGHVRGCLYRSSPADLRRYHPLDREAVQLRQLGIVETPAVSSQWLQYASGLKRLVQKKNSVLLVPGVINPAHHGITSPVSVAHAELGLRHRQKVDREPPTEEGFIRIARRALLKRKDVYLLGTLADQKIASRISQKVPRSHNITGQFNLLELILMAENADLVVGHDTGVTNVLAACGCKTVMLASKTGQARHQAVLASNIKILQQEDLGRIGVEDILRFSHL